MTASHPADSDIDSLASLEDRIRRAVELVSTLKSERDAAREELAEARQALAELAAARKAASEASLLREELEGLRAERKQVRVRVERLLSQMDQLSS